MCNSSLSSLFEHIFFLLNQNQTSPNAQCVLLNYFPISFVDSQISREDLSFSFCAELLFNIENGIRCEKSSRNILFGTDHKILSFRSGLPFSSRHFKDKNSYLVTCQTLHSKIQKTTNCSAV